MGYYAYFSEIAFSALIVAIVSTFFAIKGKYHLYWISAVGIYIISFLAGFSIAQMTVGLTLAIGYSFGRIKNKTHRYSVTSFVTSFSNFCFLMLNPYISYCTIRLII